MYRRQKNMVGFVLGVISVIIVIAVFNWMIDNYFGGSSKPPDSWDNGPYEPEQPDGPPLPTDPGSRDDLKRYAQSTQAIAQDLLLDEEEEEEKPTLPVC